MNRNRTLEGMAAAVIVLSIIAALWGVWPGEGSRFTTVSAWGESVDMHGEGLYHRDSHSMAVQAIAQDWVTLVLGVPLMTLAIVLVRRGSYRGRLLLTGAMGYFLYTYASYSFLMTYNRLFLIYVALFALALFGFVFSFLELDVPRMDRRVRPLFPRRSLAVFFLFIAVMLFVMWMGRIIPSLISEAPPFGLETYTTLVIQALDLGVIAPAAVYTSIALFRRRNSGYALSVVIVLKGLMMFSAVTAMAILMAVDGIEIHPVELIVFPAATLVNFVFGFLVLKNVGSSSDGAVIADSNRPG